MDYDKTVDEMLKHLAENFSPERFNLLMQAAGFCISVLASKIKNHDRMHEVLHDVFGAIEMHACQTHVMANEQPQDDQGDDEPGVVDAETFLRDHFHPTKTND